MNKAEIEKIKDIFDSIICLAIEGPDVMRCIEVVEKIRKEADKGYDLVNRHITQQPRGMYEKTKSMG